MSCWDVLGIEPTRNGTAIQEAYNQQVKFANPDEAIKLQQALSEALAEAGLAPSAAGSSRSTVEPRPQAAPGAAVLSAAEHQVVREVALQVQALLNDPARLNDVAVWKAVLTEPPADEAELRQAIADRLEGQLRPMAAQGGVNTDVASFLGGWFGWTDVEALSQPADHELPQASATEKAEELDPVSAAERESMKSFWPAVIGWGVGLVVLTSLFSSLTGQ